MLKKEINDDAVSKPAELLAFFKKIKSVNVRPSAVLLPGCFTE